jgi:hypothetical protein
LKDFESLEKIRTLVEIGRFRKVKIFCGEDISFECKTLELKK